MVVASAKVRPSRMALECPLFRPGPRPPLWAPISSTGLYPALSGLSAFCARGRNVIDAKGPEFRAFRLGHLIQLGNYPTQRRAMGLFLRNRRGRLHQFLHNRPPCEERPPSTNSRFKQRSEALPRPTIRSRELVAHDRLPPRWRHSKRCLELSIEMALVGKSCHVRRLCEARA